MLHLVEDEALSRDELRAIERLIDDAEATGQGEGEPAKPAPPAPPASKKKKTAK